MIFNAFQEAGLGSGNHLKENTTNLIRFREAVRVYGEIITYSSYVYSLRKAKASLSRFREDNVNILLESAAHLFEMYMDSGRGLSPNHYRHLIGTLHLLGRATGESLLEQFNNALFYLDEFDKLQRDQTLTSMSKYLRAYTRITMEMSLE